MYKISEISQKTGLSTATIRYYEMIGLLSSKRKDNNYREFDDEDLNWLTFIENMKKTGMKLNDIKHFSDLKQKGTSTVPERLSLLDRQKEILILKIDELKKSLDFIEETRQVTKNC